MGDFATSGREWLGPWNTNGMACSGCPVNANACRKEATQGVGQFRSSRIQDGDMVQPRRAGRRRLSSCAFPSVEADVMMITTGQQERRLRAEALRDFKAKPVAVKLQRTFQVGHFQVNVADADVGVDALQAGV
jgi:hypothetical protein